AVQVPAHVFDHRVERPPLRIPGAAAEEEVLEEMGDAVHARMLVPRTGAHVGGEHPRVEVRELHRDDAEAVSKHGLVDGGARGARDSVPPEGIASRALRTRLSRTCRICPASAMTCGKTGSSFCSMRTPAAASSGRTKSSRSRTTSFSSARVTCGLGTRA